MHTFHDHPNGNGVPWRTLARMCLLALAAVATSTALQSQWRNNNDTASLYSIGPHIWAGSERNMTIGIVKGLEHGLVTSAVRGYNNPEQEFITYEPTTGTIVSRWLSEWRPNGQHYISHAVDPSGQVCVINHADAGTAGKLRVFETATGRLLNEMDVRCAVRAVSKQHDRLLIYVVPENRWELRRLSTLELVTEIPDGMPMLSIHFDDHYGVFYATGRGPCLEFDAATGTLLRTLPGTYGPVRRLRGTDTLFCAGVQADVNTKATFKLVDMTNGKVLWKTQEHLSNGRPLSVAGELMMTRSADGRTIYVYGMYGGLPSAPSVRYVHIVSFSLDRGLERFMMGRPLHLENDRDKREGGYLVSYYDAASQTVILDDDKVLRHGGGYPLAPTALRVPIEAPPPLPMVHCDGQRLRVIAEGWHLDHLYDIDGRSVPLPCPGTPCRDVHVAHLAAGTYLCRLRNGDDHHTTTISIRR